MGNPSMPWMRSPRPKLWLRVNIIMLRTASGCPGLRPILSLGLGAPMGLFEGPLLGPPPLPSASK
eukprot:1939825-Pyramimonas_sp.AAC.1